MSLFGGFLIPILCDLQILLDKLRSSGLVEISDDVLCFDVPFICCIFKQLSCIFLFFFNAARQFIICFTAATPLNRSFKVIFGLFLIFWKTCKSMKILLSEVQMSTAVSINFDRFIPVDSCGNTSRYVLKRKQSGKSVEWHPTSTIAANLRAEISHTDVAQDLQPCAQQKPDAKNPTVGLWTFSLVFPVSHLFRELGGTK
mmetsp:Transcript_13658/g.33413  ORF Transcript_13658/g.33413 Transcript_13658/m.33413 type:complete len:200 (-) Transcript_13658:324-923(-)